MSTSTVPSGGLTLRSANDVIPQPAIAIRLNDEVLEDVKEAAHKPGTLAFISGSVPRIRIGNRTIDLTICGESFRHELYSALTDSTSELQCNAIIRHTAQLKLPDRKKSIGVDMAMERLKNTMAMLKQEKQAASTNISNAVVSVPKNRFEAAREQKQARRRGLLPPHDSSPSVGAVGIPHAGTAPTSAPVNERAARAKAMRTSLIHLLAIRPVDFEGILSKTHIPKRDLDEILPKIAEQVNGHWQLQNRPYKDLDVWKFAYSSQDDRDAAVERAIKAYDRMRIGKDEDLWQKLLPQEKRGRGITLSRLQLNSVGNNRNLPQQNAPGQTPQGDTLDEKNATSITPRLGPSVTPKLSATSTKSSLTKRLFAKDPQKQRATEAAKEKKRKERENGKTASDNDEKPPRKKQNVTTNNPKVKSAEFVSTSDESGEEGEIRTVDEKDRSQRSPAARKLETVAKTQVPTKAAGKSVPTSSRESKVLQKDRSRDNIGTPSGIASSTTGPRSTTAKPSKPSPVQGKGAPHSLAAPISQHKSQLSPQKPDSRPTIPSPLGAARPRVASDVSDRSAIGVQRPKQGVEAPKGLGITNGTRKRQDTVTGLTSQPPVAATSSSKVNGEAKTSTDKAKKSLPNGTVPHKPPQVNGTTSHKISQSHGDVSHKTPKPNGVSHKPDASLKRKSSDSLTPNKDGPPAKHRKTESSGSSGSVKAHNGNFTGDSLGNTSGDSSSSIMENITYNQGVNLADRFRNHLYPQYLKLYDEQEAMEQRGEAVPHEDRLRLLRMHARLSEIKQQIAVASEREHEPDE